MNFEVFDRAAGGEADAPIGAVVRVDHAGRMVFSVASWRFLTEQHGTGLVHGLEVSLLFSAEARCAAVQPVVGIDLPASARFTTQQTRSQVWPRSIQAREFVDFWQVNGGEYMARLLRGPGPRMLTFDVGPRRPKPAADAPAGRVAE